MKKIPTVWSRESRPSKPIVTPGCEWVLDGEGVATRKYDGTCVEFDGLLWWARRTVKQGQTVPLTYVPVDYDDTTGTSVGWVEAEFSPFARYLVEAVSAGPADDIEWAPGTYELCGPKINGNPEHLESHMLFSHDRAHVLSKVPRNFEDMMSCVLLMAAQRGWEGLVFKHPDGRMAKIKARDFGWVFQ